jgi:Na+/H+-dicarboxylate symporter
MSFTVRVLLGLVAGLAVGIGVSVSSSPWLLRVPAIVEPVGILFINAIRMTVIPLVMASLVVGVAATRDARTVGRLGVRSLALFVIAVSAAAVFAAACSFPLLARLQIDPAVAASLREAAARSTQEAGASLGQAPSFARWVTDLLPANVFKAASDGAMLPLILFSLVMGLALTRVGGEPREAVLRVFQGIADAMLVLVGWVLQFAPVGVFALAIPLAARMGLAAAGALVYYIALLSLVSAAFIVVVLYPAAVLIGRVPLARFARAAAPAQAVAFTSRSSLAALPATIEGAREGLGLPEEIVSFFLPLAASMFRVGAAMAQVVGVLFIAAADGHHPRDRGADHVQRSRRARGRHHRDGAGAVRGTRAGGGHRRAPRRRHDSRHVPHHGERDGLAGCRQYPGAVLARHAPGFFGGHVAKVRTS